MSVCLVVLRLELPSKARSPADFDCASKYCIHCCYIIYPLIQYNLETVPMRGNKNERTARKFKYTTMKIQTLVHASYDFYVP